MHWKAGGIAAILAFVVGFITVGRPAGDAWRQDLLLLIPPRVVGEDATNQAEHHYGRGNLYLEAKRYRLALREFRLCLAADSTLAMAYRSRGIAYMHMGQEERAVGAFERFVALSPNHTDASRLRDAIYEFRRLNPQTRSR